MSVGSSSVSRKSKASDFRGSEHQQMSEEDLSDSILVNVSNSLFAPPEATHVIKVAIESLNKPVSISGCIQSYLTKLRLKSCRWINPYDAC